MEGGGGAVLPGGLALGEPPVSKTEREQEREWREQERPRTLLGCGVSASCSWAPGDDGILELGQPWLITSGSLRKEENVSILRF